MVVDLTNSVRKHIHSSSGQTSSSSSKINAMIDQNKASGNIGATSSQVSPLMGKYSNQDVPVSGAYEEGNVPYGTFSEERTSESNGILDFWKTREDSPKYEEPEKEIDRGRVSQIGSGDPNVGGPTPSTHIDYSQPNDAAVSDKSGNSYFDDITGYLNIANPVAHAEEQTNAITETGSTSKSNDSAYESWQDTINPDRNISKQETFFGKGGDFQFEGNNYWAAQGYTSKIQKTKADSVIDPVSHMFDNIANWHNDPTNIAYQERGVSPTALITNKDGRFIVLNPETGKWERRVSDEDLARGFKWNPAADGGKGMVIEPTGKEFKTGVKQGELFEGFDGGQTPHHEGKADFAFPEQRESTMYISGRSGVETTEVQQIINSQRTGRQYNEIIADWQSKFLIRDPGVTKTHIQTYKNKVLNQISIWKSQNLITAAEKREYEKDIKLRAKQVIGTLGDEIPRKDPMLGYSAETQWTLTRGAMGTDPGRHLSFEDLKTSNNKKLYKVKQNPVTGSITNFSSSMDTYNNKGGSSNAPESWGGYANMYNNKNKNNKNKEATMFGDFP